MKVKKLLSTFAALAIAASSFAGLGINASAAITQLYSNDFETEATAVWTTNKATNAEAKKDGENTYLSVWNTTPNNRYANLYFKNGEENPVAAVTDKGVKLSFDFNLSSLNLTPNRADSGIFVISENSTFTNDGLAPTNPLFALAPVDNNLGGTTTATSGSISQPTYKVNGNAEDTMTMTANTWYTLTVVADPATHIYQYDISANGASVKSGTAEYSSNIAGLAVLAPRGDSVWRIDNVAASSVDMPKLTLSSEEVTVKSGAPETVTVSDINGMVSVESSDDTVITAEYADNAVTITYVAKGVAEVTVKAENDGVTVAKKISVTSGEVVQKNVTVNYYKTGSQTPVKTDTTSYTDILAGNTVNPSTETFIEGTSRYVFDSENVSNTSLPYTVTEDDTDAVIKLYFTEQPAVNSYTVKYTGIDGKTDDTIALTDKYVGDEYVYVPVKYVEYGIKWYTTDVTENKITLKAEDNSVTVNYTEVTDKNIVSFTDISGDVTGVYSGGSAGTKGGTSAKEPLASVTLNKGVYNVEVVVVSKAGSGKNHRGAKVKVGETETTVYNTNENKTHTVSIIVTADSTAVEVRGSGTNDASDNIDYVLITKTGELAPSIASVVTTAPEGMTAPTAPEKLTTADDDTKVVDYSSVVTEGKTVTTIYVKVDNGSDTVKPVITLSNGEVMTVTKASYDGGYFICQYVGDDNVTVKSVTYTGATEWTAPTE